jgi:hypothetical protein
VRERDRETETETEREGRKKRKEGERKKIKKSVHQLACINKRKRKYYLGANGSHL